jgi:tRNA A-37 threonylcarbamoyl transferase component Bud32
LNWIYLDDHGGKHQVGLYHGDRTGHVMVYVNSKVIIIDFHIRETKKYSFYIGGELCELELERAEERFKYGLKINEKANTPLNRIRKKYRKRDMLKSLALMLFVIILIVVLSSILINS